MTGAHSRSHSYSENRTGEVTRSVSGPHHTLGSGLHRPPTKFYSVCDEIDGLSSLSRGKHIIERSNLG